MGILFFYKDLRSRSRLSYWFRFSQSLLFRMRSILVIFLNLYGVLFNKTAADGVALFPPSLGVSEKVPLSPIMTKVGSLCENNISSFLSL